MKIFKKVYAEKSRQDYCGEKQVTRQKRIASHRFGVIYVFSDHAAYSVNCGLNGHKRCLRETVIECSLTYRLHEFRYNFDIFGGDLNHFEGRIPEVIFKCVFELESRGFSRLQSIYKIKGNSTVVNMLVKSFSIAPNLVDLTEIDAYDIAAVLKRYLKELKEPLLTYECYCECIKIAASFPLVIDLTGDYALKVELVSELLKLVHKLPFSHRTTLAFLVHHLKRVTDNRISTEVSIYDVSEIFAPLLLRQNA
ncbi:minor histocompatibility protein HA-1-like protein [Dinothrombium tinctorium]|uniref:Minor histocompatibility protein HA-1-like protein n=1 Tax=Dinothrombium tinctorium TaxID=1965070 RepID=A0A443REQ8_9ACAR|nr:minor histocompatibility protein HA-1-like protein [Dinothrombium tinctorium]